MKSSTEFRIDGGELTYEEMDQIWNAVQAAGPGCTVDIDQTTYDERPYGRSVTTTITVEAS